MTTTLLLPETAIATFCAAHGIRRLWLFGSILRDDHTPDSDIDVLVELEPDAGVGFLGLSRMERELSQLLGRRADLNTIGSISPHFRDQVLQDAEMVFERP